MTLEERFRRLWDEICVVGQGLALDAGFELPDEWVCFVEEWLLRNRPDVLDRDLEEDDVRAAFSAWEMGARADGRT